MTATKRKTRAVKVVWSFIHILNGCEGSLRSNTFQSAVAESTISYSRIRAIWILLFKTRRRPNGPIKQTWRLPPFTLFNLHSNMWFVLKFVEKCCENVTWSFVSFVLCLRYIILVQQIIDCRKKIHFVAELKHTIFYKERPIYFSGGGFARC